MDDVRAFNHDECSLRDQWSSFEGVRDKALEALSSAAVPERDTIRTLAVQYSTKFMHIHLIM
jgi:hypothetical protein